MTVKPVKVSGDKGQKDSQEMSQEDNAVTSKNPLADYLDKISGFSRNAKLYMVHFMLMAFRIGAWEVAFSLYLLDQVS